jgi:NADH-quinone oxidoreductase subunit G
VAETPEGLVDAAAVLLSSGRDVRFLSGLRRGNVHGALDMGLAPGMLPGRVALDDGRGWFESAWPMVPAERGMDATAMLQAAADGRIETLILLGADPLSDFPDRDLASRALAGARTVIALDQFLTDSSRRADIVLPVAGFAEVGGTTTNLEGRVSTLNQRVTAPGTAQADWIIAANLAFHLGQDLGLESVEQITDEIARRCPSHTGLTVDLLAGEGSSEGVVVPLPATPSAAEDAADATDDAETPDDAETAAPDEPQAPATVVWSPPAPSEAVALDSYSFRLIATRKLYDDGVLVQRSPSLAGLAPGTKVTVSPYDFDRIGVSKGSRVRVISPRGRITLDIDVDPGVPRGCAAVTFNQPDIDVASLIDASTRVTDVRIEREDA